MVSRLFNDPESSLFTKYPLLDSPLGNSERITRDLFMDACRNAPQAILEGNSVEIEYYANAR